MMQQNALFDAVLALADDQLILGHRDSEWCGRAPILEEDIAFANIALDELGHAKLWYELWAESRGEDVETTPDRLIFHRAVDEYRCAQIVELPKGDWAFTVMRQFLCDAAEMIWLNSARNSSMEKIAQVAAKIQREELYHMRHMRAWLKRLGLGTDESHRRMQMALDALWHYTPQLFAPVSDAETLIGVLPDSQKIHAEWQTYVSRELSAADLKIPTAVQQLSAPRTQHTAHLSALLGEMQEVPRALPAANWP